MSSRSDLARVTPETRDQSLIRPDATAALTAAMAEQVLMLDGSMGVFIQRQKLSEEEFRGDRFADWESDVKGNNDLLSITQPEVIRSIHDEYLAAGADIIETNTFSAQRISMADYGMQELSYELNYESARLARAACDAVATEDRPRCSKRVSRAKTAALALRVSKIVSTSSRSLPPSTSPSACSR